MTELTEILSQLISFKTTDGRQSDFDNAFNFIGSLLNPLGLKKYEYSHNGIKSVVWSNSINYLTSDILLSAHVDVVPGNDDQFLMLKADGKLWGRGVSDMKFAIASFAVILKKLHQSGNMPPSIAVMITSDEEEGGINGTNYLVNQQTYRPKLVILPDGGEGFELVVESKGVLHLKCTTFGQAAHAAYPWDGSSAIDKLVYFLGELREIYPQPRHEVWENTVNIGQIVGGVQTNQVAEKAEARLDFRLVPGTDVDELIGQLQGMTPDVVLEKIIVADPFTVNPKNKYIKRWLDIVKNETKISSIIGSDHGTSDARFFSPHNIPVIMSKPISGGDHSPSEWLDINSWQKFTLCLEKFLLSSSN